MSKIIEFFKKMWKLLFPGKVEGKPVETPVAVVVEEKKYFAPIIEVQEIVPAVEEVVPTVPVTPIKEPIKKSAPKKKATAKKAVVKKAAAKKTTNKKKK